MLVKLVEQVPDSLILTDRNGVIEYVNPAFGEITGYNPREVIGRTPRILKSGSHPREYYEEIWKVITSGGVWRGVLVNRDRQGRLIHMDSTITALRGQKGSGTHFIALQRDITAQVNLQDEVRDARAMEALGSLTFGVSHDINNLLTPIMGWAELSRLDLPPNSVLQENLSHIMNASMRARDILQELMDIARSKGAERSAVDLGPLVQEAVDLIRPTFPAEVAVSMEIDPHGSYVFIRPTQVFQAVVNLLVNAGHAMPEGGNLTVKLSMVSKQDARGLGGREFSRDFVCLAVKETGVGMNQETRKRVFDPYFTTKSDGIGTGLGLFNVMQMITENDGFLGLDSSPDQGSCFCMYFPVTSAVLLPTTDNAAEELELGRESILVVDDEPLLVKYVERLLGNLGYNVAGFTDCEAALKTFRDRSQNYDLLIVDFFMPQLAGDLFVRGIRELRPDLPELLFSGGDVPWIKAKLGDVGRAEILQKPVEAAQFSGTIRRILDGEARAKAQSDVV